MFALEKPSSIARRSHKRWFARFGSVFVAMLVAGVAWFALSTPKASATSDQLNNQPQSAVKTYRIKGVSVAKYSPPKKTNKPPIIMIHGGQHGKWAWQNWALYLSKAGYEVHALDWYNHGDSDRLPESQFIKRSIVDVANNEVKTVARHLGRKPILVGHSMGGLAAAVYASEAPVEKLVLLTPVMPSVVHPDPVPLPVDMTKPFPLFPYEEAKQLFFTTLDDNEARWAYAQLVPESPQAVWEATRWTVDVNLKAIRAPKLLFATELDPLTPAEPEARYAKMLGAKYEFIPGIGHSDILLKDPEWQRAAQTTLDWLRR